MNDFLHKIFLLSPLFLIPVVIAVVFSRSGNAQKPVAAAFESQTSAQYDPSLLTWSEATSSAEWETRDSGTSFVFQNKMWTIGGLDGNHNIDSNHNVIYWQAPHFNDIWTSTDGVSWQLVKAHAEWPPRRSMSVLFFHDKLWMFGGWSPVSGYASDVWQSSDGITWTEVKAQAPWPPREGQTAEVFQGKMWMMGGVNYAKRETMNDVWWSDDGVNWHEATTTIPWSTRWDHATAVFKGKIFLSGGMDLKGHLFKDVWSTADGVHWELMNANPEWATRQGHALVVFHDLLWTIGRLNDTASGGVNDVWYSGDGVTWLKTKTDPLWKGREDHSVLVLHGRIYVFEGMDSDWRWRNDVWVSSE